MILYLSSNPCFSEEGQLCLNPANGFVEQLKSDLPPQVRCLFICSDPDRFEATDFFAGQLRTCLEGSGISVCTYRILDRRNGSLAPGLIRESDLLILAGGHVPTQNRFFRELDLAALVEAYSGIILGISAGSMNAAKEVYAHPEEPGEATDSCYQRFLPGLGLTDICVLPHFSDWRGDTLDGLRLLEDIAVPDSCGRAFLILEDGSYARIHSGNTQILGTHGWLKDGILEYIEE